MFHLRESAGGVNGLEGTTVHLVLKPCPDNKSRGEPRVDAFQLDLGASECA